MKKLFIVVGIKTNYRSLLASAIEEGDRQGVSTSILDLNDLVEEWKPYPNNWDDLGIQSAVLKIGSFADLRRFAKNQNDPDETCILFLYPPTGQFRKAWKIFQSRFRNTGLMTLSPVPNASRQSNPAEALTIRKRALKLIRKGKRLLKPVPAFWIISGSASISIFESYFRRFDQTQFIYAHSIEYELYHYETASERLPAPVKNDYLLVLDQGWFSKPKPDFLTDQQYPPTSRARYSVEIIKLLREISSQCEIEVLVSCHPKADLDDTKALYSGFDVVNQPSSELIRHCAASLSHTSTSIGYAVMADKPLILISNDELTTSVLRPAEIAFSRELGIDYINTTNSSEIDFAACLDEKKRQHYPRYRQRYLRQDQAKDLPLWPLVFSELGALN